MIGSVREKRARGVCANQARVAPRRTSASPFGTKFIARAARLLAFGALVVSGCGCDDDDRSAPAPPALPVYGYSVVNVYPHDPSAFTQGLVCDPGQPRFYESTGRYGASTLREVEIETGTVVRSHELAPQYWGEGVALVDTQIVQLTWKSNVGFVYGKESFTQISTFDYDSEGWGIAYDGERLVMSDGTSTLRFLDPATLDEVGRVSVRADSLLVAGLNELEFVKGEIYANVWLTDRIAIITPETGRVRAWINLAELLPAEDRPAADVLNGIAYDAAADRLFVTGKFWPSLFEIELVAP